MKHHKYSPSASKRWIPCPGSLELIPTLNIEDSTNPASELGTGVHEVGEICLKSYAEFKGIWPQPLDPNNFDGMTKPIHYLNKEMNGHIMTQDCIDAVTIYVDYCINLIDECDVENCFIEESFVHPEEKDLGGTSDFACINKDERLLEVVDYKNGVGEVVWPEDNSQGMIYALFVLYKYCEKIKIDTIRITIIQPRHSQYESHEGVCSWDITLRDLKGWESDWLFPAIENTKSENPLFKRGDEQCRWCPAWNDCPDKIGMIDKFKEMLDDSEHESLTEERHTWVLDNEKLLNKFIKNVKKLSIEKLLVGEEYAERKVIQGLKNRSYTGESDYATSNIIGKEFQKVDYSKFWEPHTLISPASMEKLLKAAGYKKPLIDTFMKTVTERLDGEKNLVLLTHKGEAITNVTKLESMVEEELSIDPFDFEIKF